MEQKSTNQSILDLFIKIIQQRKAIDSNGNHNKIEPNEIESIIWLYTKDISRVHINLRNKAARQFFNLTEHDIPKIKQAMHNMRNLDRGVFFKTKPFTYIDTLIIYEDGTRFAIGKKGIEEVSIEMVISPEKILQEYSLKLKEQIDKLKKNQGRKMGQDFIELEYAYEQTLSKLKSLAFIPGRVGKEDPRGIEVHR